MNAGQAEDACSQLDQPNNKCGYCAETKKFSFATLDGKNTAVDVDCNPRKWTMDAGKCSELRDKEICDAVKLVEIYMVKQKNYVLGVQQRKSITYEKY